TENLPPGYLFLCPLPDFQSDLPACFHVPDCPEYWSLDPSGAESLGLQQARNLGFPDMEFRMEVLGTVWDASVYAGICEFHEAKGFDP
ncbi:hypothetical protein B0H14DRAFT_2354022, partial [Mycena olivaceomarginata]